MKSLHWWPYGNSGWSRYWERYNRTGCKMGLFDLELAAIKTVLPLKEAVTPEGTVVDDVEQSKNKWDLSPCFLWDKEERDEKIVFVCLGKYLPKSHGRVCDEVHDERYRSRVKQRHLGKHGNWIHKGTQGIFQQYQIPYDKDKNNWQRGLRIIWLHYRWVGCFKRFRSASHVPSGTSTRSTLCGRVFQIHGTQEILRKPMRASRDAKAG